jgi:hypothetical protein
MIMKQKLARFLVGLATVFSVSTAHAQFVSGIVLTAAQLNTAFAGVLPLAGGTLTGPIVAPSATFTSPLGFASGGTGANTATGATSALQYLQGGTGSAPISVASKLQQHINAADFGALCNGSHDDTSNINAALLVGTLEGGAQVDLPPSAAGCIISSTLSVGANVLMMGQGPGGSHILANATNISPIIQFGGSNSAVANVDINAAYAGLNTSGAAIAMGTYTNQSVRNVSIEGPCIGVDVNGNTSFVDATQINNVQGSSCYGLRVGALTTLAGTVDPRITRTTVGGVHTTPAGAAMLVLDAGGLYADDDDFIFAQDGVRIQPSTNQQVDFAFFSNTVLGDTNATSALVIDTGAPSAVVKGLMCQGCWAASAATTGMTIGNSGAGIVAGIHFVGLRDYNNTADGLDLDSSAVSDVTVDGGVFCGNGTGYSNISAVSGVTSLAVRNSTIGGACDGFSTTPSFGALLAGSNSDVIITGNDFTGVTTPIGGASPTGNTVIANNINLDNQAPTVASAATIALTIDAPTYFITGTTGISTISGGWNGRRVSLITNGGSIAFATGGNICNALTSTANVPVTGWYSGSCWYLK